MKVHHLNCAASSRFGNSLAGISQLVCHCLLIETRQDGLVLVDSGIGLLDVAHPWSRLGWLFTSLLRGPLNPAQTARRQIQRLGYRSEDVRHILPTHLDLDHAGGLADFPDALVHVYDPEFRSAMHPSMHQRIRYRRAHWAHGPRWLHYRLLGETWFGFNCVRRLAGLPAEIMLVPLAGHTTGHCAVAVKGESGWLLHAGDAYLHHGQIDPRQPYCPMGLRAFQWMIHVDRRLSRTSLERLRELRVAHAQDVRIFCSHDPVEFGGLTQPSC